MRKANPLARFCCFFLFLILIGSAFQSYSQCPIVNNSLQSFCDIPTPVVSDLLATDTGGGIRWYATATSVTPLLNSTPLINGMDYFAGDAAGTCTTRQSVKVSIVGPPWGLNFQGVCVDDANDATISDLVVIGNDVKWYSTQLGGTSLSPTTVLVNNTVYYADQVNLITGCRSSRLPVYVRVELVQVPTGESVQKFCSDLYPPPTVADLVTNGNNNNWYASPTSVTPLDPSVQLIDGEKYYATTVSAPPCESTGRFEVLVVFEDPNDSGDDGTFEICETDVTGIGTINLFSALGGAPFNNGVWTGPFATTNGSLGTVDISAMTFAGSPYDFVYEVNSSAECDPSSSIVSVIIVKGTDPGNGAVLDLCESGPQVDLFTALGGAPDPGGSWSPALNS